MFNDNVSMVISTYDQYILNLLYDPRVKAGMTCRTSRRCCGRARDVRVWVRKVNNCRSDDPLG